MDFLKIFFSGSCKTTILILFLIIGVTPFYSVLSAMDSPDIPPMQWGDPGVRECMVEAANRWHNYEETPIRVFHPYATFAGQTAPGDGITVANEQFDIRTHDVILRHMRFRHGVDRDQEVHSSNVDEWTFRVRGGNHVILDHITVTWGMV